MAEGTKPTPRPRSDGEPPAAAYAGMFVMLAVIMLFGIGISAFLKVNAVSFRVAQMVAVSAADHSITGSIASFTLPFTPADVAWYLVGGTFAAVSYSDSNAFSILRVFNPDGSPSLSSTVRTYNEHVAPVNTVAFAPVGNALASGSQDGAIKLWGGALAGFVAVASPALFPPNALVTLNNAHPGGVTKLAFDHDGETLLSCGNDGFIKVWSVAPSDPVPTSSNPKATLLGHTGAVLTIAWHPLGTFVASAGVDGTLRLWTNVSGVPSMKFLIPLPAVGASPAFVIRTLTFSPNGGALVAGASDGVIRVWGNLAGDGGNIFNTWSTIPAIQMPAFAQSVRTLSWRGNMLLSSSGCTAAENSALVTPRSCSATDQQVQGWAITAEPVFGTLYWSDVPVFQTNAHTAAIRAATLSAQGSYYLTAADDKAITLWSLRQP